MWTKVFWLDTLDRSIRTFAQALLSTLTVGTAIYELDWTAGMGIAATAAAASVLTSISTSGVGAADTPAIVIPEV